jgi:hypothetical protein
VVRSALHLLDRPAVVADIPSGSDALEELGHGKCNLLITTWEIDDEMRGLELALRASQRSPETGIVILADVDDPGQLDEETAANSPFIYMSRPVDVHQFMRVIVAALEGTSLRDALRPPAGQAAAVVDLGPIPAIDISPVKSIVDHLLTDLGAMAIFFLTRGGELLLERGAVGYLNREQLTRALMPMVATNYEVKGVVGGQASALQFYDGDQYDVFVLSVGLHHFLCVVFDGQGGARQLGAVSRFGRKAAEDIIAVLGANAWLIAQPAEEEELERPAAKPETKKKRRTTQEVEPIIPLQKGTIGPEPAPQEPEPASEMQKLEPVENFDVNVLFNQKVDEKDLGDLFDPDKLEEIAKEASKGSKMDFDQAVQIGLLNS